MKSHRINRFQLTVCLIASIVSVVILPGCSIVTGSITRDLASSLAEAMRDNNDPETIREGSPAYLILIDALVKKSPGDPALLDTAAMLHATYADAFIEDEKRALTLTDKALAYALAACCSRHPSWCGLDTMQHDAFEKAISGSGKKDIPSLYALGASWASWIALRSSDLKAFSRIPRIESIMNRVTELDETYMDGGAYLYLGTIATLLPPMLGGQPEKGRAFFEKALALSGGRNLMINVVYAKQYARLVYDRELHDRLLNDVLSEEASVPGYTLVNTLAKQRARTLLSSAGEYF